jgi:hypothetical protein
MATTTVTYSHSEQASTHQCTIHPLDAHLLVQLRMILNWVNTWFHLGNQVCRKIGLIYSSIGLKKLGYY